MNTEQSKIYGTQPAVIHLISGNKKNIKYEQPNITSEATRKRRKSKTQS